MMRNHAKAKVKVTLSKVKGWIVPCCGCQVTRVTQGDDSWPVK